MIFEKTIADDYKTYIDDERGYSYQAWDGTCIQQIRSHDQILHSDAQSFSVTETDAFNDLQCWALARMYRRHELFDPFFAMCERLINSDSQHPALNYSEILEIFAEELARAGNLERAKSVVVNTKHSNLPLDLDGRITLLAGDENEARNIFNRLITSYPDDAELHFDIAENVAAHGHTESALEWLDSALEAATRTNDRALLVDIELLRLDISEIHTITEE